MKARCHRESHPSYSKYGGIGITVCERWHVYFNFLADMGERPTGMQIDRINLSAEYSPDNCKWSTLEEKGSKRKTNRWLTANGETRTLKQWEDHLGIDHVTLWERMQKWPLEKALTTPKLIAEKSEKTRYGHNWDKAKRKALKNADGKCQRCKKPKNNLHVHHRIPIRYFQNPEDANHPENLMPVCKSCHTREHKEMESRYPLLNVIPFTNSSRRSRRDRSRFITWRGQTRTLTEWARLTDRPFAVQWLSLRLKRYPLDKAMEPFN